MTGKGLRFKVVLAVMLFSAASVFAGDSFHSLNLKTAKGKTIIKSFDQLKDSYGEMKDMLEDKLEEAYENYDSKNYNAYLKKLAELPVPVISEEETKLIVDNIKANKDNELAAWLYRNSRFYKPVLTYSYKTDHSSYVQKFSTLPGNDITLPDFKLNDSGLVFMGWGLSEDKVSYKAGEVIKMPYDNLTLYAILEKDPSLVEGKSIMFESVEGLELKQNTQQYMAITIKNNGNQVLDNIEVKLNTAEPMLVILEDTARLRYLRSGDSVIIYFKVISKSEVGAKLYADVVVKDSSDKEWKENLCFTIKE